MWILSAVAAVSLVLGLFPMLIAHPLVEQTPAILAAAYWIRTAGPWLSIALAAVAAAIAWRKRRVWALLLVAPPFAYVYTSRVYFTEWFFAPAAGADWTEAASYTDVGVDDMVIGVVVNGTARAYPVRYLAFHHVLNDSIGTAPIVPTY